MAKTNELQIGREYELRVKGNTPRKITYLGLKQKNYQKLPNAMFIEDSLYADGKPAVWSVNIPNECLRTEDSVLTAQVGALSSGLFAHQDEIRVRMRESKWAEILAVA